jgi:hypothetical protein
MQKNDYDSGAISCFDEDFGKLLLIRIFDLQPRIKLLFGFYKDIDPTATELGKMALIMRAVRLTRNVNQVLELVCKNYIYMLLDLFFVLVERLVCV